MLLSHAKGRARDICKQDQTGWDSVRMKLLDVTCVQVPILPVRELALAVPK
jgi:hypothetical protein